MRERNQIREFLRPGQIAGAIIVGAPIIILVLFAIGMAHG